MSFRYTELRLSGLSPDGKALKRGPERDGRLPLASLPAPFYRLGWQACDRFGRGQIAAMYTVHVSRNKV